MVFYPVKVSQGFFPDLFESSQKLHHITRVGLGECRAHVAASSGLKVLHSSDSVSFLRKEFFGHRALGTKEKRGASEIEKKRLRSPQAHFHAFSSSERHTKQYRKIPN